jgi:chromate transport protein ChrA
VTILAQVLIIGKRARGFDGAAAAMTGMLIPSLTATILVARGYEIVSGWPRAVEPLGALAAVAAGLALGLSTQMLREMFRRLGLRTAGLSFVLYLALTFAVRDNALIVLPVAALAGLAVPALFAERADSDDT